MKRSIFALALIAMGSVGVMTSCASSDAEDSTEDSVAKKEYYCPMKCEGDEMHAEEGSCSVCKMDLVKD